MNHAINTRSGIIGKAVVSLRALIQVEDILSICRELWLYEQ
jgi:hypothetical protein